MKLKIEPIKEKFTGNKIILTDDLYRFYQSEEPKINKSTVNWRIYELVQNGILQRIGKGKFVVGQSIHYLPEISNKEIKINSVIKKEFPFIKYCIWNSSILGEFLQHQSSFQFIVVEVEKDALESVFYSLKDNYDSTFKKPTKQMVEEFVFTRQNSIIINSFISEAPIQSIKNVPTSSLEKLLVDLYSDKNLFYFLQGYELVNIYKNAFDKYTVNKSKLLRYADRRGMKIKINKFINSIIWQ
jgi:hypothetical protein